MNFLFSTRFDAFFSLLCNMLINTQTFRLIGGVNGVILAVKYKYFEKLANFYVKIINFAYNRQFCLLIFGCEIGYIIHIDSPMGY